MTRGRATYSNVVVAAHDLALAALSDKFPDVTITQVVKQQIIAAIMDHMLVGGEDPVELAKYAVSRASDQRLLSLPGETVP